MKFNQIYNQKELKRQLISVIDSQKISHAQLFYGKPGGVSLAFALAYVSYLYCENKNGEDACGECSSCLKNETLSHPDVHFSFPHLMSSTESSKKVTADDVLASWKELVLENEAIITENSWRENAGFENKKPGIGTAESERISSKLALKSFEGGYKTLVMWLPESMNESASNKLLKLIEEPPAKTLFILVTENPDAIIQTIRSRSQMLTIPDYKIEDLVAIIKQKHEVSDEDAMSIANICNGNLEMALELVTGENDNQNFELFKQWMRLCYQKDISSIIDWVDDLASLGREQHKSFIQYALHFVRNAMMTNYMGDKLVNLGGEELAFNQKFAPFIHHNNAIDFYNQLSEAYYNLDRNASPKPLLLDLSIKVNYLIHQSKA